MEEIFTRRTITVTMPTESDTRVKAVDTCFRIVDLLTELEEPTIEEIATEVGLSTTAVHNHLKSLEEIGYVTRRDGSYQTSLKFLEMGGLLRSENELFKKGREPIDSLADETGELANLMVEENGSGVHIYLSKGENAVVFDTYTGRRYPLHNNALGKSILSQLSRERAEAIVDRSELTPTTDNTITDRDELWQELERIRDQGVAFDDEERIDGLRCVAAPVVVDDRVLGSISVSGPASRIKGELFREQLPEKVERTADIISININYQH